MQTQNPILDDLAHLATGAAGVVAGLKGEIETQLRQRFERWLTDMDMVPREEFDAVKAMAAKARTEQEAIAERLSALEARLAKLERPTARAKAGKARAAKATSSGA